MAKSKEQEILDKVDAILDGSGIPHILALDMGEDIAVHSYYSGKEEGFEKVMYNIKMLFGAIALSFFASDGQDSIFSSDMPEEAKAMFFTDLFKAVEDELKVHAMFLPTDLDKATKMVIQQVEELKNGIGYDLDSRSNKPS